MPGSSVSRHIPARARRGHRGRARAAALAAVAFSLALVPATGAAASTHPLDPVHGTAHGTTYFVDSARGSDSASGRDPFHPWRSLARVNATTFQAGDQILLHSGRSWTGQLWPKGSGGPGRPIVIDRYGWGTKPVVNGAGQVADAVRLHNQQYWVIRNLAVTNANPLGGGEPGTNLRDLRGIGISGDVGGQLNGFRLDGVDVHDVTGEINWIGGNTSGNAPGITFRTGWDRSKNTGGIVFRGLAADPADPGSATVLHDIVVEHSTVARTSFAGIIVKQYTGSNPGVVHTGWGERTRPDDAAFAPHTGVVIRNNFITQDGTDYGCNGIYLTDVRGGRIEDNVVYRAGTSGIEAYYADDVVVQRNEVYQTQQKAGGADSNGIDPDNATTNIIVQRNFVHDNGDGILLCQCGRTFGDVRVRYNVITGNHRYQVYLHSNPGTTAYVYNNTIVNDAGNHLVYGYGTSLRGTYHLWNNILYSTRANASLTTSPTIDYEANLYGGAELAVPDSDTRPIVGDPMFVGEITGPYGTARSGPRLDRARALQVTSGARAVGTGIAVADNGGIDYAGQRVYNGRPDLGAFEYYPPWGQFRESINGFVHDQYGHPVASAQVTFTAFGQKRSATTQQDGFYRIPDLLLGSRGTLTIGKELYLTSTASVTVHWGDTLRHDVTLTTTQTVGTIAGRVLDERAQPLDGALVTVLSGGSTVATARSGADGGFTAEGIPGGDGYTVRAQLGDRLPDRRDGLSVTPASSTDAGALLLAAATPTIIRQDGFDDLALGPLPDGTDGWQVTATGNAVDVAAVPDDSDRSVHLARTANSGGSRGTNISWSFDQPPAGLITVEASVMREDPYVSGNDWFGLPYVYDDGGAQAISVAFDKGDIKAYDGGSSRVVGHYDVGTWYRVRLVVDTVNQRFDLFVDGQLLIDDGAFRSELSGIGRLAFYANSSNYGSAYVNDVVVEYGRGADPGQAAGAAPGAA